MFSKVIGSAALVLATVLVAAEARNYQGNNGLESSNSAGYANSNSHRPCSGYGCNSLTHQAAGCVGYACNRNANGPFGPYHSYPVRPTVYGGRGLYSYQGYSRHTPVAHYRPIRSASSYNCLGQNCHRSSAGFSMRPVKALVLAPSRSYAGNSGARYNNQHRQAPRQHGRAPRHHSGASSGSRYNVRGNYRAHRAGHNSQATSGHRQGKSRGAKRTRAYNPAAGY